MRQDFLLSVALTAGATMPAGAQTVSRRLGRPMAVHSSRTSPAPQFEEDQPMYLDKTEALRQVRPADDAPHEPRRREHRVQMTFADEAAPALRASTGTP
jgi:hypothetical protein